VVFLYVVIVKRGEEGEEGEEEGIGEYVKYI